MSEELVFLPRKLMKTRKKSVTSTKNHNVKSLVANGTSHDSEPVHEGREGKGGAEEDYGGSSSKGALPPHKEKLLDDSAYTSLLELALSDYAIWKDEHLTELIYSSETEGFVPFSYLINHAPVFYGVDSCPPESTLLRCAKASSVLECRMLIVPEYGYGNTAGGFEVRRKDWERVKERVRRYTAFQWNHRMVYVENLPHYARTISNIYTFLNCLLESAPEGRTCPTEDMVPIQGIEFPPHRDDPPDGPPPLKSKGFAFVVLAHTKHVDYLLRQWPWEIEKRPSAVVMSKHEVEGELGEERSKTMVVDALDFGFRCLSKKEWDGMKERYLNLQRRLVDESLQADKRLRNESVQVLEQNLVPQKGKVRENGSRASLLPDLPVPAAPPTARVTVEKYETFPVGCLVFIKNVNPETNKTTLRALFSTAIANNINAIDYVDYNKGLDSCYLRLSSPNHAKAIFEHFTSGKYIQRDALDNIGALSSSRPQIRPLEVELVTGRKEEMYWLKVPEKIRMQALEKARLAGDSSKSGSVGEEHVRPDNSPGERRKSKRKR